MPTSPPIACPCGARRQAGEPCARCGRGKRKAPQQGGWQSDSRYSTARWQKIAKAQLQEEPLCRTCMSETGRAVAATVADHIEPHRGSDEAFWYGKLQSQCYSCHGRKSAAERRAIKA